jgi:hypothetical protein
MAETAPDITRNPDAIWLSPACAEYAGDRTWAAPAPADTCEECPEPWVRYVREDLATPAPDSEKLREAGTRTYDILHSKGSDSIVLCDPDTHDDIAEVFHCDRHTVNQTAEQAMETARLFASADRVQRALRNLLTVAGTPITERQEDIFAEARAALGASA